MNDTTIEFTCEVACRTPIIGCNINLESSDGSSNKGLVSSNIVNGSAEAIGSRFVTVVVNNIDPTAECTYTAIPVAPVVNGISISFNGITGVIPAIVQGKLL